jgi:hypothetical protein
MLARYHAATAVSALSEALDEAVSFPCVEHRQVTATASRALDAARQRAIGLLFFDSTHRRSFCNSDSRKRRRGVALASVANRLAP